MTFRQRVDLSVEALVRESQNRARRGYRERLSQVRELSQGWRRDLMELERKSELLRQECDIQVETYPLGGEQRAKLQERYEVLKSEEEESWAEALLRWDLLTYPLGAWLESMALEVMKKWTELCEAQRVAPFVLEKLRPSRPVHVDAIEKAQETLERLKDSTLSSEVIAEFKSAKLALRNGQEDLGVGSEELRIILQLQEGVSLQKLLSDSSKVDTLRNYELLEECIVRIR